MMSEESSATRQSFRYSILNICQTVRNEGSTMKEKFEEGRSLPAYQCYVHTWPYVFHQEHMCMHHGDFDLYLSTIKVPHYVVLSLDIGFLLHRGHYWSNIISLPQNPAFRVKLNESTFPSRLDLFVTPRR